MMQDNGYLQVIDFGVSKILENARQTMTFTGTPEYLAPEVQNLAKSGISRPYTIKVDWWAVGIMAFEMLIGYNPFEGK